MDNNVIMKIIFLLLCIFTSTSCRNNVIRHEHLSDKKNEQTHEEFMNNSMGKINRINKSLDSLQSVLKKDLIKDDRCPIIYDKQICDYTITCIIYNDTTIIKNNFLGLAIDILITTGKSVLANLTLTRESFFEVFNDGGVEFRDYDIRNICKLDVIQDNIEIDIMTCIPDTDLDYYFKVTVFPNGTLKITNISDKYWDIEGLAE